MTTARSPLKSLDLERIVIYPRDYDEGTRARLLETLKQLDIHYECGYWG